MPTILSDPPPWLYIVLVLAFALPLGIAFFFPGKPQRTKDGKEKPPSRTVYFVVSGASVILLIGLFAFTRLHESDQRQIDRKLREMSEGVRERNMTKVFQHVSDSFRYGTHDKTAFRQAGERAQQAGNVDELTIWDVNFEPIGKGDNSATVVFRFKVIGNALTENQFLCKAKFVRDPDGQWRLQGFEVFPPTGLKNPYQIPGL